MAHHDLQLNQEPGKGLLVVKSQGYAREVTVKVWTTEFWGYLRPFQAAYKVKMT